MSHPGDPDAPAREVVNCRCAMLPGKEMKQKPAELDSMKAVPLAETVLPKEGYDPFNVDRTDSRYFKFAKKWRTRVDKLPAEQQEAIRFYTSNNYTEINNGLRGKNLPDYLRDSVDNLEKALTKNTLGEDTTLFRGVGPQYFDRLKAKGQALDIDFAQSLVGTTLKDPAFGSTSVAREVAEGFARSKGSGSAVFEIKAPKDTKGAYVESITEFHGEYEFLLPQNYGFKVVGVQERTQNGLKQFVFQMEIVQNG